MGLFYIGLDDTDNDDSPGTGQLARRLAREAEQRGATCHGITRHQFLIDPRIPYTSHNSGACLAVEWPGPIEGLDFAFDLIQQWSAVGSDPGVCIVPSNHVPPPVIECAWRATREVLTMDFASAVANASGIQLRALGGTGQGIIGALSSVGLRADGNEGRFLELPGLRDLGELVTHDDLTRLGITPDHTAPNHQRTGTPSVYKTFGWVRPRLTGGKAIWPVQWSDEHECWIGVDQKRSRPLE